MSKNYGDAVMALNGLQTNAQVISKIRKERDAARHLCIPTMIEFCDRIGITLNDLDKIPVIHVSGTKGKGSVCALSESILRQHGLKTGFFSSPHLIEVRERIRINGRPLSGDQFSKYFWEVYDRLIVKQEPGVNDMPAYFRFLTIMAFHVFLQEKVDVAVIEVGLGGEYDCTNVIRTPVVCGISSLGIDHVEVLGDTIAKIAWQKAGILKRGCPAVTVSQPEDGLYVIAERAREKQCPLSVVPSYDCYDWQGSPAKLGIHGSMQKLNASLAIQLCNIFLERYQLPLEDRITPVIHKSDFHGEDIAVGKLITISENVKTGLEKCLWPGRNQIIKRNNVTYYLDGAHTKRSMSQCIDWFVSVSEAEKQQLSGKVSTFLVFNYTGDRQSEYLMKPLIDLKFDGVVFCPNVSVSAEEAADLINYMTTSDKQLERCYTNQLRWEEYEKELGLTVRKEVLPSVGLALAWCTQKKDPELTVADDRLPDLTLGDSDHIQVMITGSLHLVGCALRILDPGMNDRDVP